MMMIRQVFELKTALALLFAATVNTAVAQNCYYPNGDVSTTDAACSTDGGACCPLNWECLSNGLCYYSPESYYGRYTCTDRVWGTSCANYCTANNTAPGNEAILQCDDGSYCCDGDRSFDCCTTEGSEVIHVPRGLIINSITKIKTPTPVPSSASRTTEASSTTSTGEETSTTLSSSRTTDVAAAANTDAFSSTTSPSSTSPTTTSQPSPKNNTLTIGLGIGIPLGLILASILALLLYRHLHNRPKFNQAEKHLESTTEYSSTLPYMYEKPANLTEIDSYPIADINSPAKQNRISELSGSNHFLPTTSSPISQLHSSPSSPSHPGYKAPHTISPILPQVSEKDEEVQELPPEGNPARTSTLRVLNPDPVSPPYMYEKSEMNGMGEAYRWSQGVPVVGEGWRPEEKEEGEKGSGQEMGQPMEKTVLQERANQVAPEGIDIVVDGARDDDAGGNRNSAYQPYSRQMGNLALPVVENGEVRKVRPISPIVPGALGSRRDELDT